jgi:hypothetical protein
MQAQSSKQSSISAQTRLIPETARLLTDLANLRDDGIGRFRKNWGKFYDPDRYVDEVLLDRRDELRMLWTKRFSRFSPTDKRESIGVLVTNRSEHIYEIWKARPYEPLQQFICEHWLGLDRDSWLVYWGRMKKRIWANPRSLSAVLAWACVHHADYLSVCENSECSAPYYIATRCDQKFCSTECASPSQRASKLDWWRAHRSRKE